MNLSEIMDEAALARLVADKYIRRTERPDLPLVQYNYTPKAQYDKVWTPETLQCRGLIVDALGVIVAWPFDKFKNWEEYGEEWKTIAQRPGPVEITAKIDGSLGIAYHWAGSWYIACRGGFTREQAVWGQQFLHERYAECLPQWPTNITLLFEMIYPGSRMVVDYGETTSLTLIGARNRDTGRDYSYTELWDLVSQYDMPVPTWSETGPLPSFLDKAQQDTGIEGWVVRWPDGFRVKIKTAEYVRLHRLVSDFNARRVRDVLLAGGWDSYLPDLPEEFRVEAERMARVMHDATQARMFALMERYDQLAPLARESRKVYALAVLQEPLLDRPYLFSLADGKPITDKIMGSLDLDALGLGSTPEASE